LKKYYKLNIFICKTTEDVNVIAVVYQKLLSVQNSVSFDSGICYLAIILDVVDLAIRRPGEHAEAAAVPGTLHTADTRQYWIII
jgi:hypothetical protein